MSRPRPDFSGPYEASASSFAGPVIPRRVVHIDSEGYTEIKDSRECSPGVDSRPPLESEIVAEVVRAELDPLEVEASFVEVDATPAVEEALRREGADRAAALLAGNFDGEPGEIYAALAAMADRDSGDRRGFNFRGYLEENPYEGAPPRFFRVASSTRWAYNRIPSTVTLADVALYRTKYHIPSDVHIYAPESDERADQAPDGLVAVDELVMEVGISFPLHYAVSYFLASWNLAPLQLRANAWLFILCTNALFGKNRLHRLLTVAEMNFLYELRNTRGTVGGYHLQPRLGRVVFGVPNRVHGDPSKWFWVGGNWRSFLRNQPSTSECSIVELEIPTDFRICNPFPRIPSVQQLSFDFLVVWNRIRGLPQSERHIRLLNSEESRLAAGLFQYPRHARIPDRPVARYLLPSEAMKKYANMMNRFQELAQAKRAAPPGSGLPLTGPSEERSSAIDLPSSAAAETEVAAVSPERSLGRKRRRLVKTRELMIAGRKAGRRSPPLTRAHRTAQRSPPRPIESSPPRVPETEQRLQTGGFGRGTFLEEVAAHVRRATEALPRAWNEELEAVAGRRPLETAQAALTHALQTSVLMAKVVNDLEVGPDVARLQTQLDTAVKRIGDLQGQLATVEEKNKKSEAECQQALFTVNQLRVFLEKALDSVEEGRRVIASRDAEIASLQGDLGAKTEEAANSAAELARRTEELSIKTAALATAAADLEAAQNEIAALKAQLKEADRSPSPDAAVVGEFSYYMAFADTLRTASRAGLEVGPLVELLRSYATENPMHSDYPLPILDLQTVHGIDLSWYPRSEQLILPTADMSATEGGDATAGSNVAAGSNAAGGDDVAA
ncbi:hypothetical protein OROHE_008675 [Orobanche hederae]